MMLPRAVINSIVMPIDRANGPTMVVFIFLASILQPTSPKAVIFLEKRRIRKYAEDGCEVFFGSRLFCVVVSADFVFVGY